LKGKHIILFFCCVIAAGLLKASENTQFTASYQRVADAKHELPHQEILHAPSLSPDNLGTEFPEQAARRIRTRFRAVSSFYLVVLHKVSESAPAAEAIHTDPIRMVNQVLMPPFYYVFLFRLKPF
jgi:hypothetical protein